MDATYAELSIRCQCELLGLARSTLYYVAADVSPEDVVLMKAVDQIYTRWPFYGSGESCWSSNGTVTTSIGSESNG